MSETSDPSEHGEVLKSNVGDIEGVLIGMAVSSIDGESIGKVKEIKDGEMLIDRPLARDLWVPLTSILATEEYGESFRRGAPMPEKVVLNVSSANIDRQGWRHA